MKIKISKSQWDDMGKKSDKMLFVKSNKAKQFDSFVKNLGNDELFDFIAFKNDEFLNF